MDQDSFRKLLESSHRSSNSPQNGGKPSKFGASTSTGKSSSKHKTVDASQPAFQPRKVKKDAKAGYRDRAAERRVGQGNDYAQVEAVLEDFERRNADNIDKDTVDEQRKYLGGDSDHSILVKGLDFALLEQNKARAALSTEDDDSLEAAFAGTSTDNPVAPPQNGTTSKKRTREELLRELKDKRQGTKTVEGEESKAPSVPVVDEVKKLEEAKKAGKFKPIGFKPIGATEEKPKKKKKTEKEGKDGERKKKRRKVEGSAEDISKQAAKLRTVGDSAPVDIQATEPAIPGPSLSKPKEPVVEEPPAEDFDIFEGVGEYEGVDMGEEEEDEQGPSQPPPSKSEGEDVPPVQMGGWFVDDEATSSGLGPRRPKSPTPPPQPNELVEEGEMEAEPLRLQPLETSALPSIKDFLAMDEAAEKEEKRRKRKEKKKGGGGGGGDEGGKMTAEARADRDYQRLKSYQAKKGGGA